MYPRNDSVRNSMSISVFCLFLSACGGGPVVSQDTEESVVTEAKDDDSTSTSTSVPTTTSSPLTPSGDISEKKLSIIELNTLKAFPTAEGAGAGVSGGRGGLVVYVTNRNSSGKGSLNEALTGYGNKKRTILFAVGGRFNIDEEVYGENIGNVTIAGQSANDIGGVYIVSTYKDGKNGRYYINNSDNIQLRYISAKGGWEEGIEFRQRKVAFNTPLSSNVIYDHYSGGFSSYTMNVKSINRTNKVAGNITIQYSLMHEGVYKQNVGSVTGVNYDAAVDAGVDYDSMENAVDVHHNAYILLSHRHKGNVSAGPSASYKRISNYIYGIGARGDNIAGDLKVDYVNNYYEADRHKTLATNGLHKIGVGSDAGVPTDRPISPSIYMSGNKVVQNNGKTLIGDGNQWSMWSMYKDIVGNEYKNTPLEGLSAGDQLPNSYQRHSSQPKREKYPITVTPTNEVKDYVLNHAGAGTRFNIDGTTYNYDEVDSNYILIARSKTGPQISGGEGTGGIGDTDRFDIPDYDSKKRDLDVFDADRNGLPDEWEQLHSVNDPKGVKEDWEIQGYTIKNNAGYTNLEMYLAELAGDFYMLAKKQ